MENQAMLKAQETSRGKDNVTELNRGVERAKAQWEASVKKLNATNADIAAIEASIAGESADSESQLHKVQEELAAVQAQAAQYAAVAERTVAAEAQRLSLSAEIERMRASEEETHKASVLEQSELQDALSEARSAAAKWEQVRRPPWLRVQPRAWWRRGWAKRA
eukprot:7167204-Prymnesium_polylepis.1